MNRVDPSLSPKPQWSGDQNRGGGLDGLLKALSEYGVLIVIVMAVTALAIYYFTQMRSSASEATESMGVFPGNPSRAEAPEAAGAQRTVSSLDYVPRANFGPPPEVEKAPTVKVEPPASPPPVPVQAPLPKAVQAPAEKPQLVTGKSDRRNAPSAPGGFPALRDKEEKPQAQGSAPLSRPDLGSQAPDAAAQKVRQMMPLIQAIQQGGFQTLGAIKQRAYELQDIGRELLDAAQQASTTTIHSGTSHVYWEGSGPQQGKR